MCPFRRDYPPPDTLSDLTPFAPLPPIKQPLQMRHLSSEEQGQLKPEDEAVPEEVVQEQANRDQMITQPLLTDRSPSPRGRQMSACGWVDNDDASDGDGESVHRLRDTCVGHVGNVELKSGSRLDESCVLYLLLS